MGCDIQWHQALQHKILFQSTHPSWGATVIDLTENNSTKISIHAPIVGCDGVNNVYNYVDYEFQSTHPSWGATQKAEAKYLKQQISIHAPIVGCDQRSVIN